MQALLSHESLPLSELSSTLVNPDPAGASTSDPGFETRRDARTALSHVHLPKLEDAGLVSGDWSDDPVSLGHHPDIRDGSLTTSLLETVEQEVWGAIAAAHSTRRRHEVFAQLARSGPTLTLDQLAEALTASSTQSADQPSTDGDRREQVAVRLHHLTLPKLDDAGLVSYDPSRHEVEYVGGRWFDLAELADALESGRHSAADTTA